MIIDYIERYKDVFGVELICTTLTSAYVPIAPSTLNAARTRAPSARAVRDEELKPVIARVHKENYGVYGIRKMHAQLNREQVLAGCQAVSRNARLSAPWPVTEPCWWCKGPQEPARPPPWPPPPERWRGRATGWWW
jgi:hypothetical protein